MPAGAVTTADLYREMIGMRTDVVRSLTMLDIAAKRDNDHEARLRTVEAFRYRVLGAAVAVSVVTSALGTWIGYNIHH